MIQVSNDGNSYTSTLTITSAEYADRGTYSCGASNIVNGVERTVSDSASLIVHGIHVFIE